MHSSPASRAGARKRKCTGLGIRPRTTIYPPSHCATSTCARFSCLCILLRIVHARGVVHARGICVSRVVHVGPAHAPAAGLHTRLLISANYWERQRWLCMARRMWMGMMRRRELVGFKSNTAIRLGKRW